MYHVDALTEESRYESQWGGGVMPERQVAWVECITLATSGC